jgi:hypothetical protein
MKRVYRDLGFSVIDRAVVAVMFLGLLFTHYVTAIRMEQLSVTTLTEIRQHHTELIEHYESEKDKP